MKIIGQWGLKTKFSEQLRKLEKLSRISRILRTTFLSLQSKKQPDLHTYRGQLTASEIEGTKEKLIIRCQKVRFPDEHNSLSNKEDLHKKSCLMSLNLIIF